MWLKDLKNEGPRNVGFRDFGVNPCERYMGSRRQAGRRDHPENAALDQDLVSPGNFVLVKQGMRMRIVPMERLEWPPPYKAATEKYSPQVQLSEKGELQNFVAGLPFPLVDPNDPQATTPVVWNFSLPPDGDR